MYKARWHFLILVCLATCYAPSHVAATDRTDKVYDAETGQYFTISDLSKREDPQFLLPDPDPTEFPPEFLDELLTHCDDPIPGALEFLQKSWIAFNEFAFNWSRYPVSHKVLFRILRAIQPRQLLHAAIMAVLLSVTRYLLERCLLEVRFHLYVALICCLFSRVFLQLASKSHPILFHRLLFFVLDPPSD